MASAYIIDGAPHSEPPVQFDLGNFPRDARQTTGMTTIIVEPKEDVTPEWPTTHDPSTSEAACITMLIRRNTATKTKGILITPSKRDSLSPSLLSSSRTSSSSCVPADATTETTPETTSSTESLKRNSMIDPVKRASTQASESCEEGDEKTFKEQRLNVKFAPLPDLGPRKRRGIPLGIAARSRLVRRRRTDGGPQQYVVSTPMWTDEEMEEQRQRLARAWEKEREGREYYSDVDENGDLYEDPFITLGKIMKDAGRQLWQRMSHREGKDNLKSVKGEEKKGKGKEDDKVEANDTEGLDSPGPSQQLDASSSQPAPSEIDPILPPTEKEQAAPSGQEERADDGTFSWDEVGGKDLPSLPDDTITTRKKNLWSRMRTQSKPKESPPTPTKSSARRSFVRSLRGRSMERSNDDEGGAAKFKDKDKSEQSVSLGLRRSLSF